MRGLLFGLLFLYGSLEAQILNNRASIKSSDNQAATVIQINESLQVFSQPNTREGWFTVRMVVMVERSNLNDQDDIYEGADLFNQDGERVGVVRSALPIVEKTKAHGRSNRDKWMVVLEGQAFKTQFERGSLPELELESLFSSGKRGMMGRMVDDLISQWGLIREDRGDFSFYPMYKENYSLKKNQDFKLLLVYKKGGSFYGVVTNGFTLDIPAKTTKEDPPMYFYFPVMKATDRDFNDIFDHVFDFITL